MKLQCAADPRAYCDVADVWTRKLLREHVDILSMPTDTPEALEAADVAHKAYMRRVVKAAHLVDADGNEFDTLDAILEADNGTGLDNVDAAVVNWWKNLPFLAYAERQKNGGSEKGQLAWFLVDPAHHNPPPELMDGWLLRLFGFNKTLEELDGIDLGRVMRAMEALNLDSAGRVYLKAQDGRDDGDMRETARALLALLPEAVQKNIETSRKDLKRGKRN